MEDIIKLKSRGRAKNTLKKLKRVDGSESKTYLLKSTSAFLRTGLVNNGCKFIDPSGGPMIVENSILEEANAEVESIDFTTGLGWTITFK